MGSTRDWFPSLRSVASHRGGFWMVLDGHWRLGMSRGLKALYLVEGSLSLVQHRQSSSRGLTKMSALVHDLHGHIGKRCISTENEKNDSRRGKLLSSPIERAAAYYIAFAPDATEQLQLSGKLTSSEYQ